MGGGVLATGSVVTAAEVRLLLGATTSDGVRPPYQVWVRTVRPASSSPSVVEVLTGQRAGGEPLLTGELPHLPGGARAHQHDDTAEHDVGQPEPVQAVTSAIAMIATLTATSLRADGTPPRSATLRGAEPARAAGRTPCSPRRRPRP